MNIGLFGGSFDPIHRGHIALAGAAADRYSLRQVLFVPANVPPHKQREPVSLFLHRYAMVALATQAEKRFVPSLLEAPEVRLNSNEKSVGGGEGRAEAGSKRRPRHGVAEGAACAAQAQVNYTIDTVRRLRASIGKADRIYFLMGIDAFRDIAKWHEARALLAECEFVVASRPGYSLRDVAEALPEDLRPAAAVTRPFQKQPATGELILPGVTVHLLEGVHQNVSATAIRDAAAQGKPLARWLDPLVAEYIRKVGLYRKEVRG